MYIYVDVLIITSIYANFFLLKTTARLIHLPLRNGRCIAAAIVGSVFSLVILLPSLNNLLLLMIRLFSAALMIVTAFGGKPARQLFGIGAIFFLVCFIFAGMEYGLSVLAGGKNMFWHNSVLYVNISLLTLIVSTIVSYMAVSLFRRYLDGGNASDRKYTVTITKDSKTVSVQAVADTCNNLADVFTGKPVIICGRNSLSGIFPREETEALLSEKGNRYEEGWRFIPFSTIAVGGMLPIFRPDCVTVKNNENGSRRSADVYVGLADSEMEYAVFNPKIL